MSLLVFCPTRGRPAAARECYDSFLATRAADSKMLFVIDDDEDVRVYAGLPIMVVPRVGSMNGALQLAVDSVNVEFIFDYYGFVGDDHRFRTPGWDRRIMDVLDDQGGGFAYANDLYQCQNLPTQVFVTAKIVKELGWFGLRGAHHLYLDNAWKVLGEATDCLFYFPDVVIEHMHPYAGKGVMDESYERVNSREMDSRDRAVFDEWLRTTFGDDIKTVLRVIR